MKGLQIFLSILLLIIVGGLIYFTMQIDSKTDINKTEQVLNTEKENSSEEEMEKQEIINNQSNSNMSTENKIVTLKTNQGDIKIEMFADKAPKTVSNFVNLATAGFYDGVKFHRVIKDFMIQGGDPLTKDDSQKMFWGTGDPGYKFEDEFGEGLSNVSGTISMANSGPNTNGSQFFINTADNTFLDGKHAVFGKVVEGMDVVEAIENTETGDRDLPVSDMVIVSVVIE